MARNFRSRGIQFTLHESFLPSPSAAARHRFEPGLLWSFKQKGDELLEAHAETKRNLYLGRLRLSEVEGGRFCEAAFRLLEHVIQGAFTPIGTQLNTDRFIQRLGNLPSGSHPDAIRIHIPRALRLVY